MKHTVVGIVAHVDAGKTTLSEGLLYTSGMLRKLGRVDHQDTFLDTFSLEKARGITIFSKEARLQWNDLKMTFLDTPGHVDFSTEMERTLQVLDYAILVVNGADGIQGHTRTLWKLLIHYRIPTFIFVNKMDIAVQSKEEIMLQMQEQLSGNCIDFTEAAHGTDTFYDSVAMCHEELLDAFLEQGSVSDLLLQKHIAALHVYPCYFGSALKLDGLEAFLDALEQYSIMSEYSEEFGVRVYKITRDKQNMRVTHMKITGGSLRIKDTLTGLDKNQSEVWNEKVNQIRLYDGDKFETTDVVAAGEICAVTGLTKTFPGQGLGVEKVQQLPVLQPVLRYRVVFSDDVNPSAAFTQLRTLEEEDPQLQVVWNSELAEVHMQLMGEVQIDILTAIIKERWGYEITFDEGGILYKETIVDTVEGVGHFEPLRHYAEVHLRMEPGEAGSGMQYDIDCSDDLLDKNWQRLIYTHMQEKQHRGVRIGAPLTDVKLTLVSGKAHNKHTEGGDFREATYRAIRQGLKYAKSTILEPYYNFQIRLPISCVGRAMQDIEKMFGKYEMPDMMDDFAFIKGKAPVSTMQGYLRELQSYSKGLGTLQCEVAGYFPCHNAEEVETAIAYDSEGDLENPTGSVFCSHGSGYLVPWNQVYMYMHLPLEQEKKQVEEIPIQVTREKIPTEADEQALEEIWVREFGGEKKRFDDYGNVYYREEDRKTISIPKEPSPIDAKYLSKKKTKTQKEYLLVDGYNVIFAWEELKELSKISLDAARGKLLDIMCNYQGYCGISVIVVFDAYKVKGNPGSVEQYHNIDVIYTKEAETADMYIEKVTHKIGKKNKVTVASSDGLEQTIVMQQGALRMSALELQQRVKRIEEDMQSFVWKET